MDYLFTLEPYRFGALAPNTRNLVKSGTTSVLAQLWVEQFTNLGVHHALLHFAFSISSLKEK